MSDLLARLRARLGIRPVDSLEEPPAPSSSPFSRRLFWFGWGMIALGTVLLAIWRFVLQHP